ncbi:hypothetical protein [Methanosarcina barkeri]|uniref:hypothetical protein n=1 Tax=Methanosarcina barkeri TaxID=2208 RepID=UPI0012D4B95B|nr:hypothetical protein [Methanosarcina barkeri]
MQSIEQIPKNDNKKNVSFSRHLRKIGSIKWNIKFVKYASNKTIMNEMSCGVRAGREFTR